MTRLDDVMNNAHVNESSLSKRCDASEKQLNDWREGKKSIDEAQAGTVASVARALDVAIEDLLEPQKDGPQTKEVNGVQRIDAFLNTMNNYDTIMKSIGYINTLQLSSDYDGWRDEYSSIAVEAMLQRKYFVKDEIVYLNNVCKAVLSLLPCNAPIYVKNQFEMIFSKILNLSDYVPASVHLGNGRIVDGIDVTYDQLYAYLLHANEIRGGRLRDVPLEAQYFCMFYLNINRRSCLFDLQGHINLAIKEKYLKLHNENGNI
ncbi:helix-turn-helix transcriptional regulator [Bifidobacterium boum]|uniref:Helix-turn-helix transcriptional regulator n=1 Tax=Bifidobacterium boum TaxID=78343 RepID=A0A848D9B7_9BIFI|nr:helix-turn-helix transcriptional regulator [Bifidobacterium boum]NMF03001.1 helix-turn-helix transcriptional regulator [Bifidobacterium boum]